MTFRAEAPAIWALALGQTLTYAGVYYAFPALLPDLLLSTGWSGAELAAGPTLAFLVTAALTPFTGRLVDRDLGGEMLVILPILAAVMVGMLGLAQSLWVWMALWAVIGLCQAGMYYETCFAFLTRRLGLGARAAITKVTLVAGLAGTLAFPLGHWMAGQIGPVGALMAFGGLVLLAVPINLFAVRRLRRLPAEAGPSGRDADPSVLGGAIRRAPFWAIAGLAGALGLNHAILVTFVLVLFTAQGASAGMATLAAACIGPAQVLGRLILMANERRVNNAQATMACVLAMALAAISLILAGAAPGLIFLVAALQGAGMGTLSILRPVLIAEYLGRRGFGTISGAIAVSPILASALGPSAGAMVMGAGGAGAVHGVVLVLAAIGLGLTLVLVRMPRLESGQP